MMMKLALGFSKTKLRKPYTTTIGSSVVKLLVLHSFKAKPLSFRESSSSWATTSRIPRQSTQAILNSRFSLLSSIVHYEKSWCMCKIISTYINIMIVHHYSLFICKYYLRGSNQACQVVYCTSQCLKMARKCCILASFI